MDDLDKPVLLPFIYEEIEADLHNVDKRYWARLKAMQVPIYANLPVRLEPKPPEQPSHLCGLLGAYAQTLFYQEARRYPRGPKLAHWLSKLSEHITERVLDAVEKVERAGLHSQTSEHHGVAVSKMREAFNQALVDSEFPGDSRPLR